MPGRIDRQDEVFHPFNLEDLVPAKHPLRPIKSRADGVLLGMSRRFSRAYGKTGRKSIPRERLIKVLLLQALSAWDERNASRRRGLFTRSWEKES